MKQFILGFIALGGLSGVAHAQTPGDLQCVNRDDGSSICVNDRVLDYRDAAGTITAIYNDLTAVVTYDGGDINTIDLQYLSREVGCIYGYCAGDDVIDNSNNGVEASISDIYENGTAEVTDDGGATYYYVDVNDLTPGDGDDDITITYGWAPPRPYPDVTIYNCIFGPPPFDNPYAWPIGYPYSRPIFGRTLFGIFPIAPIHLGFHGFNPYPYQHPVPYRGGGRVPVGFGNRHPVAPGGFGHGGPGRGGPGGGDGNHGGPGRGPGGPLPVGPGRGGPGDGNHGGPGHGPGGPLPVGPGRGGDGNHGGPGPGTPPVGHPDPQPGRPVPGPYRPTPAPGGPVPGPYHPTPAPAPGGGGHGGFGGGHPPRQPSPPSGGGFGGGHGGGRAPAPHPAPGGGGGGNRGGGAPGGGGGHGGGGRH